MTVRRYPQSRTGSDADDYHGERVPDPYRWLEATTDPETVNWIAAQNEGTESFLAAVLARDEIRAQVTRMWDYPKLGVPFERGGRWFQFRNPGRAWHDGGRRGSKQNVFDDFCACARWLAESGWSSRDRIAIMGGSNGGLLVGACLTQHPELFGAVIGHVGVYDMLRFHKFTIGWAWTFELGSPDDPAEYQWLRGYSPLHNVRPGTRYPATLLLTGDHDDRVVPGHSFKFAPALQAAQAGDEPVQIRVDTAAGHGAGKSTAKRIAADTDVLVFLEAVLPVGS